MFDEEASRPSHITEDIDDSGARHRDRVSGKQFKIVIRYRLWSLHRDIQPYLANVIGVAMEDTGDSSSVLVQPTGHCNHVHHGTIAEQRIHSGAFHLAGHRNALRLILNNQHGYVGIEENTGLFQSSGDRRAGFGGGKSLYVHSAAEGKFYFSLGTHAQGCG